jgi:protein disulfide-isomerase A1
MAEDFSKAATALKGKAVLADVDATIEESLARKYKVEGFPTLKLFMNGEELTDYKGGRDFDSMVKFVENARKPAFDGIATKAEYENFVEQNKGSSLLLGISLDGDAMSKLTKASFALRDLFPDTLAFGSVKDSSVASLAGSYASGDFVLLHNDGGKLDEVRYDSEKYASLEAFVKLAALPVFSEFTQDNADLYTELSQPIIIGFFESAKVASDPTYAILESLATKKKGNGKVVFVWVDSGKLSSFKDYIGIKDGDIPICSYAFESDVKLRLPASMTLLSERSLEAWVDDVIAGRVEPAIKSESIPEKQSDTGPTVVVGDSWNDIVQDPSTDVLIAQVAPWCGHWYVILTTLSCS